MLYGFATEEERRLFRSLLKVSGVGPEDRAGAAVGHQRRGVRAVRAERGRRRAHARARASGRKTAERLFVEMRDRLARRRRRRRRGAGRPARAPEAEAYGALVALGYRPAEATRLLKAVGPGTHSTEELIRRALQGAARE